MNDDLIQAARPLIELAVAEDIGPGDATSNAVIDPSGSLRGSIVAKQAGIVAGLPIAQAVFTRVDAALNLEANARDGAAVLEGGVLAQVSGPGSKLLAAERIALNFIQHLSGIATYTQSFVRAVEGSKAVILDTRKTHPGYRLLEKYAVRMGGGQNHRSNLHEMILIKDNHIAAAGGISAAVERVRAAYPRLPIEVEVERMDQLDEALTLDVDRIMLDNMNPAEMREAVCLAAGRTPLEASGNVDLAYVAEVAATGVDYISIGALTHSAPAFDVSLRI
ncbi:MAG: carboxylating nicotinate-nucleotide diphosphorylase [Anaerolineales bacterium]|jgi:nicotinate-nucleotide pyrophosphorylase (carboxylating)